MTLYQSAEKGEESLFQNFPSHFWVPFDALIVVKIHKLHFDDGVCGFDQIHAVGDHRIALGGLVVLFPIVTNFVLFFGK